MSNLVKWLHDILDVPQRRYKQATSCVPFFEPPRSTETYASMLTHPLFFLSVIILSPLVFDIFVLLCIHDA